MFFILFLLLPFTRLVLALEKAVGFSSREKLSKSRFTPVNLLPFISHKGLDYNATKILEGGKELNGDATKRAEYAVNGAGKPMGRNAGTLVHRLPRSEAVWLVSIV
jgi:hypothetical protein